LIKPGNKNTDVTKAIAKVAEEFKVNPMEGVLSHEIGRYEIEGQKVIINKATAEQKVEEFEFEENQVYVVDIVMSTGEGKSKELEARTTIYKRQVENSYSLKMKSAKTTINEIVQKYPTFPFALRNLKNDKEARLGLTEILKHDLLDSYPVLYEKQGEFVAQFKFTVLILPSATDRLNSHALPFVTSELNIKDPELLEILKRSTKRSKRTKKTKTRELKKILK